MIYLELILLVLGFFISIITLSKEEESKFKKTLAYLYISFCLISVVLVIFKYSSDKTNDIKLYKSLGDIEKEINVQSDTLISLLDNSISLNKKLDSIATKTEIAIKQREKSLKVFEEQNKLLEASNKFSELRIINDSANVAVFGARINFRLIDSLNYKYEIPFHNIGKRNAIRFSDLIVFVFKDKNGRYFWHETTRSAYKNGGGIIPPSSNSLATDTIKLNKEYIKKYTSGGTLVIFIRYYDEFLKKYNNQEYRFDFKNNWNGNIYDFLNEGNPTTEKGLDEYLTKNNIKSDMHQY